MSELAERDYFTDGSVLRDPYAYFNALRATAPVYRMRNRNTVVVTGFDETLEVLLDNEHYSAFRSGTPTLPLPFEPSGDDITGQIDAHRGKDPKVDLLVTYDGTAHSYGRSLLTRLFTPSRLKANEEYMTELAQRLIKDAAMKGRCELISEIGKPFATLVIADLLGVPAEDRKRFREIIDAQPPPGNMDPDDDREVGLHRAYIAEFVKDYIIDRQKNPRADVLTELATAKFPDGSTPEAAEVVNIATFLFTAGQDTTVKLLGNTMRFLLEDPARQQRLRSDHALIPAFVEEVLRLEGSAKSTFRYVSKTTQLGGIPMPAGTQVVVALAAANRDPDRWEKPNEFVLGREKIKEHLAFSRGRHTCIGAPLARAELRVLLERFFHNTTSISISAEHHGPAGTRALEYEASCILRGLQEFHLVLAGSPNVKPAATPSGKI